MVYQIQLILIYLIIFFFSNAIGYKSYKGYWGNAKSEFLWSISLSKSIFNDKGLLKFHVYDILNQKKNIMRLQENNKISDVTTNVLKKYFMLSFSYRFSIDGRK